MLTAAQSPRSSDFLLALLSVQSIPNHKQAGKQESKAVIPFHVLHWTLIYCWSFIAVNMAAISKTKDFFFILDFGDILVKGMGVCMIQFGLISEHL